MARAMMRAAIGVFCAVTLGASSRTAQSAPQLVASYGAWELYEGDDAVGYLCGITISGYVQGLSRRINVFRVRGAPELKAQVWQGRQYLGLGAAPVAMTFKFSDGAVIVEKAQQTYGAAQAQISDVDGLLHRLRGGGSLEIDVDHFFPTTADLDDVPEALDAMERCHDGETIAPYRPLR